MTNKRINVTKPFLPLIEDYIKEIESIWEDRWLTNFGPRHTKFKKLLEDYLEVEDVCIFTNGHMALELCLQSLGVKGEVITTPFTFVSTTHAIERCGMTPVFCDINEDDYTIDVDKIEALINENTIAIMPVHVYGNICDVKKIQEIADKYNLKVIYDGAHAFGIKYKGTPICQFGDFTMLSFHATKVFNSVEGGGLVVNDKKYLETIHNLKLFGLVDEDSVLIGTNAKMSEFHAAMGVCNMKYMPEIISCRRKYYETYLELLSGLDGIKLSFINEDIESNYSYFPIYIDEMVAGFSRDDLDLELQNNNIFARKYFYPIMNEMAVYKGVYKNATPVAKRISEGILVLPLYYDLEIEDIKRICEIIIGFYNKCNS